MVFRKTKTTKAEEVTASDQGTCIQAIRVETVTCMVLLLVIKHIK